MAVHGGGTLDQHTPDVVGHEEHSPGGDEFGEIDGAPRSPAPGWPGWSASASRSAATTTSRCETYPGYVASARADDGTLEAMELPGDRFCVAVQWHPETAADVGLLAGLVRAASEFATRGPAAPPAEMIGP